MKFEQNFHLYQVPEWEPFYISYKELKKLICTAVRTASDLRIPPNLRDVYSHLSFNVDAFNAFHTDSHEFLDRKEGELCKRYGIALHLWVVPGVQEVKHHELEHLLKGFIELRQDLIKRQWYNRVNQAAVHRIFGKLERYSKAASPSQHDQKSKWLQLELACETQYLKDSERLDNLVAEISQACTNAQPDPMRKSLYLQNICDPQSPFLIFQNSAYRAIRDDQASALAELLERQNLKNGLPDSNVQPFLYGLFKFSITSQSRSCADHLLSKELPKNGVVIDHDCVNHLITTVGRSNVSADCDDQKTHARGITHHSREAEVNMFLQMLAQLRPKSLCVLQADDAYGRLSLHYSALYGLTSICQLILNSLQELGQGHFAAEEAILSVDYSGCTPLHYAVIRSHSAVTKLFLDTIETNYQTGDEIKEQHVRSVLSNLLHVALKYQYDEIVHLLILSHVDINHQSSRGETPLYVAAQIGRADYVKLLLKTASSQTVKVDLYETVYGWTPLFIACAEGNLAIVELLLHADASQTILDHRGWTAKEHAAYRGHLAVAETFQRCRTEDYTGGPACMPFKTSTGANHQLQSGHSHIIAKLGVMQKERKITAVNLNCYSSDIAPSLHTDNGFSIEVSLPGGSGSSCFVQLPILDDMINEPFIFPIKCPGDAQLVFDIFRATPAHGEKGVLVGSGTALLESPKNRFGAKRESLIREHTVSILEKETLQFIGLGQNIASREHLQLGENTRESFLAAAKLGASFVQFDVQITRDLVPVVYHDFSLSESGTDIPIHDLSLEQFMYASKVQSPQGDPVSVLENPNPSGRDKPRSQSLTKDQEHGTREVQDRMKHTIDFMNKGFKPNTRGDVIQDSFATLEELLVTLPMSIGFDIEIKYPRLHEAVAAGVAPVAIDLNTFIDTTLDTIYRFGRDRPIILSSFTPEVCILLATKQQVYPVMFITNAGKPPLTDMEVRAGSLQTAVHFARYWGLAGVVVASEALVLCPRLIQYVKRSGLVCASYGPLNNIPENAKLQADAGLDMILADRVGLISKSLKGASP